MATSTLPTPSTGRLRRPVGAAVAGVAVSAALLAACSSGSSGYGSSGTTPDTSPSGATSGGSAVTISGFAFSPGTLDVKRGTKVTVTNKDSATHTWTADDGDPATWDSSELSTGKSFSFTFAKAGTYSYHCKIHTSMTGKIVVT